MADTAARVGYGVILKKGDGGAPEAFTDYGLEITSVNGIGFSRSSTSAVHMQSQDAYDEFIHGIKTTKPITVEVNWVAGLTASIQTLLEGAKGNWRVQFPDNSTLTVKAQITDFDLGGMTPDGKMSATMTFTASGKPTLA